MFCCVWSGSEIDKGLKEKKLDVNIHSSLVLYSSRSEHYFIAPL